MPEDWERAVAVVAHPDDLEYGAASAEVGPLRVAEEMRGAAVVGVTDVEFLDHVDGLVEYGIPLRRDLAAAFRRLQPEVVITMSFDLTWGEEGPVNHSDHRAIGLAVLDACRDAANEWVFTESGPPCRTIKDAYVAATGNPTHFVDVTDTIDAGIASLREHRAYIDGLGGDFDPDEFLRNMAGYIGLAAGVEYAMGVRRYPMG
jgi:LmbE family N-acetylglucosaminyl deacetylase